MNAIFSAQTVRFDEKAICGLVPVLNAAFICIQCAERHFHTSSSNSKNIYGILPHLQMGTVGRARANTIWTIEFFVLRHAGCRYIGVSLCGRNDAMGNRYFIVYFCFKLLK